LPPRITRIAGLQSDRPSPRVDWLLLAILGGALLLRLRGSFRLLLRVHHVPGTAQQQHDEAGERRHHLVLLLALFPVLLLGLGLGLDREFARDHGLVAGPVGDRRMEDRDVGLQRCEQPDAASRGSESATLRGVGNGMAPAAYHPGVVTSSGRPSSADSVPLQSMSPQASWPSGDAVGIGVGVPVTEGVGVGVGVPLSVGVGEPVPTAVGDAVGLALQLPGAMNGSASTVPKVTSSAWS